MIYVPLALRLHSFGLGRLHDANWTGMELYDHLKRYMRGRGEPEGVLFKTLDRGVLWLLGGWLFDELIDPERLRYELSQGTLNGEYLAWHVEEIAEFVSTLGERGSPEVDAVVQAVNDLDELFGVNEGAYYARTSDVEEQEHLLELYEAMVEAARPAIASARDTYATNYADRVFHDRELCAFISQLMLAIGIDGGLEEGEDPCQWVDRRAWPEWAKQALRARERGKCARCGDDLVNELEGDPQIDHIVPLSRGGTNDLVNLQMLCAPCNRWKSDQNVPVRNSIPPYLSRRRPRD